MYDNATIRQVDIISWKFVNRNKQVYWFHHFTYLATTYNVMRANPPNVTPKQLVFWAISELFNCIVRYSVSGRSSSVIFLKQLLHKFL